MTRVSSNFCVKPLTEKEQLFFQVLVPNPKFFCFNGTSDLYKFEGADFKYDNSFFISRNWSTLNSNMTTGFSNSHIQNPKKIFWAPKDASLLCY